MSYKSVSNNESLSVSEEKKRELAEANSPHFSIRLKDTEVLEATSLRFMVKVNGDPQPRIKL